MMGERRAGEPPQNGVLGFLRIGVESTSLEENPLEGSTRV
jgi:hypothetical protein